MRWNCTEKICSKTPQIWSAIAVAGALLAVACAGRAAAADLPGSAAGIAPAPSSLAALYPPTAQAPVHLLAMLGLQEAFSGIAVDLLEDDVAGARETFTLFQERYHRAAELVPEWRSAYPEKPVGELGAAIAGSDPGAAMRALDAVGAVCHRCHLETMAPVQLRFRWGNFGAQTVKDPLAGDTAPYAVFKRRLAATLTGISHDLAQGQPDNARRQFEAFNARFAALEESCRACHATPRRSFVDQEVRELIEELGRTLAVPAPEPQAIAGLAARIGQASCSSCHLVHVPAALAQATHR